MWSSNKARYSRAKNRIRLSIDCDIRVFVEQKCLVPYILLLVYRGDRRGVSRFSIQKAVGSSRQVLELLAYDHKEVPVLKGKIPPEVTAPSL